MRRAKKERACENAEKSANGNCKKGAKTSPTFTDSFKSSTLRKYSVIMICQW